MLQRYPAIKKSELKFLTKFFIHHQIGKKSFFPDKGLKFCFIKFFIPMDSKYLGHGALWNYWKKWEGIEFHEIDSANFKAIKNEEQLVRSEDLPWAITAG
jgi:hypothetical protein